jgi:hypothetical protein
MKDEEEDMELTAKLKSNCVNQLIGSSGDDIAATKAG